MAKQFLNSMYFRGSSAYDTSARKSVQMKSDALIFTVKDTETLKTEIKILKHPTIDFYLSKKPLKFHHFSVPVDELRKVTVPYADRDKEIAASLGKLQEFYNSASNFEMRKEYTKNILRKPNLYSADTDIEDYYKTKTLMANQDEEGNQRVASRYSMCFSDTEVDISNFDEDFPDPSVAPCPINLITAFYTETKEAISYILYDERVKEDQMWVLQNSDQFIKEYLDPMIVNEGFTFEFKLFQTEADEIRTYFADMHERKPDFCAWWNMAFDMPTIIHRLEKLGFSKEQIAEIMCHPDIPKEYKYVKYIPDPKRKLFEVSEDDDEEEDDDGGSKNSKQRPHPSRLVDWVEIPGYTQHYCQMVMYSCLRKRFLLPSYKLDDIAKEAGIGKYNLSENGYSIKDCNVKNFKIFLAYNIRDSFCQYIIEKKYQDMNQFILTTSNTRLSKGFQASVTIKNEIMLYLIRNNEIMGNAIDYGFSESFGGALVGDPAFIEQFGVPISGNKNTYVFEDAIDLDASSLYPSIMILFNIFKSALYGRVTDIYKPDGTSLGKGEGLFSDLQTIDQSIFDICEKYMGLPQPIEFIKYLESAGIIEANNRYAK